MLPVSSVQSAGRVLRGEVAILKLLRVRFRSDVPDASIGIDYASCSYSDERIDIYTACPGLA